MTRDEAWLAVARELREKIGVTDPEQFRGLWEAAPRAPRLTGLLGFLAEER